MPTTKEGSTVRCGYPPCGRVWTQGRGRPRKFCKLEDRDWDGDSCEEMEARASLAAHLAGTEDFRQAAAVLAPHVEALEGFAEEIRVVAGGVREHLGAVETGAVATTAKALEDKREAELRAEEAQNARLGAVAARNRAREEAEAAKEEEAGAKRLQAEAEEQARDDREALVAKQRELGLAQGELNGARATLHDLDKRFTELGETANGLDRQIRELTTDNRGLVKRAATAETNAANAASQRDEALRAVEAVRLAAKAEVEKAQREAKVAVEQAQRDARAAVEQARQDAVDARTQAAEQVRVAEERADADRAETARVRAELEAARAEVATLRAEASANGTLRELVERLGSMPAGTDPAAGSSGRTTAAPAGAAAPRERKQER
jgi:chromosome segregation ATPase